MKFTDGYWRIKKNTIIQTPIDLRDVEICDDQVTLYSACKKVVHRGDTLNVALLTTEIHSPIPDIIGVKTYHYDEIDQLGPKFALSPSSNDHITIKQKESSIAYSSGSLELVINQEEGRSLEFFYNGNFLTSAEEKSAAYIIDNTNKTFIREQLKLSVGEYIYGLGERFTSFVKNSQSIDVWNEDGGTSSEMAYKNIPFYMTNKGYGVFVNHPEKVSYEIGSENVSRVQFSVEGECIEYFVIGGKTLLDVLSNYTKLTGRSPIPPAWSFGLWLTTSFTTSYDEATVTSFIDGMAQRQIPLEVFHFDCFWMKAYQWCDFKWDETTFPEPKAMLMRLKERGLKICVWINPYIAQKSELFKEGRDKGYFIRKKDGQTWQWDIWQSGMAMIDFTNREATNWYKDKLRELIHMGVDSFKTDFGEQIPIDVVYHDGSNDKKMHNYYTLLYNQAVYDTIVEELGQEDAVVFARSATVGGQKFPVHWGGDCIATYESMAESLRAGLSLCMSGFGFWSHDISGFEKEATPDLYKRWVAFGLLSTHSRLHGNSSYRVPWLYDEEAVDVLRYFVNLKNQLMPYLFYQAIKTSETGYPMLRAMVLEYCDDLMCAQLDRQYMLGDSILVAPIFNDVGKADYYVPNGRWTDFFSGELINGGKWNTTVHDYFSLPMLVKSNSIIAVGEEKSKAVYDYGHNVTFHIFELEKNCSASTCIYSKSGDKEMTLTAFHNENGRIIVKADRFVGKWKILLRGINEINEVIAGKATKSDLGTLITPYEDSLEMTIQL